MNIKAQQYVLDDPIKTYLNIVFLHVIVYFSSSKPYTSLTFSLHLKASNPAVLIQERLISLEIIKNAPLYCKNKERFVQTKMMMLSLWMNWCSSIRNPQCSWVKRKQQTFSTMCLERMWKGRAWYVARETFKLLRFHLNLFLIKLDND